MSDYSPSRLRQLWDEFRSYAAQGRKEGLSIYLDNTDYIQKCPSSHPTKLIHTTEEKIDLIITRTIKY